MKRIRGVMVTAEYDLLPHFFFRFEYAVNVVAGRLWKQAVIPMPIEKGLRKE